MHFEYKVVAFDSYETTTVALTSQINSIVEYGWLFDKHAVAAVHSGSGGAAHFVHFLTFRRQKS